MNKLVKYSAVLFGGCAIAALAWTGSQTPTDTKTHLGDLEALIVQYDGNINLLDKRYDELVEIYLQDGEKWKTALDAANGEIEKANQEAAELQNRLDESKIVHDKYKDIADNFELPELPSCEDVVQGTHSCTNKNCTVPDACKNEYHGTPTCCNNNSPHEGDHSHVNGKDCGNN